MRPQGTSHDAKFSMWLDALHTISAREQAPVEENGMFTSAVAQQDKPVFPIIIRLAVAYKGFDSGPFDVAGMRDRPVRK